MFIQTAIVLALAAAPKVWVVDFSALPIEALTEYTMRFEIVKADGTKASAAIVVPKESTPEISQLIVHATYLRWNVEQNGLTLGFLGTGEGPLQSLSAASTGPKPFVRWELAEKLRQKK